jgi:hypothetical protein
MPFKADRGSGGIDRKIVSYRGDGQKDGPAPEYHPQPLPASAPVQQATP